MSKILESMSKNSEYMFFSIYAIIFAIVITFAVNFVSKDLKFAKYIPGIVFVCIGIFSLFTVINNMFDPDSILNLVIFLIACAAGVMSLLFALIIGIVQND